MHLSGAMVSAGQLVLQRMTRPEGLRNPAGAGRARSVRASPAQGVAAKRSAEGIARRSSGARKAKPGGVSGRRPRERGETGTGSMPSTAERPEGRRPISQQAQH
ncbi:hypothetical protein EPX83_24265 [Salmonella enterica]|nr:hypothetical protein [Salmonella enterica]